MLHPPKITPGPKPIGDPSRKIWISCNPLEEFIYFDFEKRHDHSLLCGEKVGNGSRPLCPLDPALVCVVVNSLFSFISS